MRNDLFGRTIGTWREKRNERKQKRTKRETDRERRKDKERKNIELMNTNLDERKLLIEDLRERLVLSLVVVDSLHEVLLCLLGSHDSFIVGRVHLKKTSHLSLDYFSLQFD